MGQILASLNCASVRTLDREAFDVFSNSRLRVLISRFETNEAKKVNEMRNKNKRWWWVDCPWGKEKRGEEERREEGSSLLRQEKKVFAIVYSGYVWQGPCFLLSVLLPLLKVWVSMCCLEGRSEEGESESESVLVGGVDEVWECVGEQVKVKERDDGCREERNRRRKTLESKSQIEVRPRWRPKLLSRSPPFPPLFISSCLLSFSASQFESRCHLIFFSTFDTVVGKSTTN